MSPIVIDFDSDKVWGPHLSISLMDNKILVWEKGERDGIGLLEHTDFIGRVSRSDAD